MVLGSCRTFAVMLRDDLAVDSMIYESSFLGLAQIDLHTLNRVRDRSRFPTYQRGDSMQLSPLAVMSSGSA
jgi:hypothetical protein